MSTESSQRPFVSSIILVRICILDESIVFLVDWIVGEIGEFILLCLINRVGLGSETSEAFVVDVDPERVEWGHAYVDSQVKFKTVYEKRILNILGNNALFIHGDLRYIINDVNTLSLRHVCWFNDPEVVFTKVLSSFVKSIIKVRKFVR